MAIANQWPAYSATRYRYLGVSRCGPRLWRIVCLDWTGGGNNPEAPVVVGPQYKTKAEALADLDNYTERSGYSELA